LTNEATPDSFPGERKNRSPEPVAPGAGIFSIVSPTHLRSAEGRVVRRAAVDSAVMRAQNSGLLVELIWAEREISRVEISRRTGLSPSTVSMIVNTLAGAGLVREVGTATSARGRRPTLLSFCDDVLNIIGVEIGIRHIAVAVTNLRGQVRTFRKQPHDMRRGPEGTLAKVRDLINESIKESHLPRKRIMGIGVAVPSPIDQARPGVLASLIYPAWHGYDIRADLEKSFKLPMSVDNDANLGALAEHWWGAGVGFGDLAYVKIGAGIGSGHIVRGEIYRGSRGTAGEIGHVSVDPRGPQCVCGQRGCLAMLIGSDVLSLRAQKIFNDKRAGVAEIIRHAEEGHAGGLALIGEIAEHLGRVVLGTLVNVINPATIVLGGEICGAGDLLLEPLRRFVRERMTVASFDPLRIVFSRLGPQAIAIGAATLHLDEALRHPERFLPADAA
jgi:predicted NBD/HSP70 family sugar kinase